MGGGYDVRDAGEGVADGLEHDVAVLGYGGAVLLPPSRRVLDVGDEEGDGARWRGTTSNGQGQVAARCREQEAAAEGDGNETTGRQDGYQCLPASMAHRHTPRVIS